MPEQLAAALAGFDRDYRTAGAEAVERADGLVTDVGAHVEEHTVGFEQGVDQGGDVGVPRGVRGQPGQQVAVLGRQPQQSRVAEDLGGGAVARSRVALVLTQQDALQHVSALQRGVGVVGGGAEVGLPLPPTAVVLQRLHAVDDALDRAGEGVEALRERRHVPCAAAPVLLQAQQPPVLVGQVGPGPDHSVVGAEQLGAELFVALRQLGQVGADGFEVSPAVRLVLPAQEFGRGLFDAFDDRAHDVPDVVVVVTEHLEQ